MCIRDRDLAVRATLAPKDQIESLSGVTGSRMESIPELEHVYTLSVDGTMVGAAQDPSVITQALNLVKERYTTPETRSLHIDSQVDIRYQYLPADTGESTAEEMAAALLAQSPRTFSYTCLLYTSQVVPPPEAPVGLSQNNIGLLLVDRQHHPRQIRLCPAQRLHQFLLMGQVRPIGDHRAQGLSPLVDPHIEMPDQPPVDPFIVGGNLIPFHPQFERLPQPGGGQRLQETVLRVNHFMACLLYTSFVDLSNEDGKLFL